MHSALLKIFRVCMSVCYTLYAENLQIQYFVLAFCSGVDTFIKLIIVFNQILMIRLFKDDIQNINKYAELF